jgi:hypothetical protein
MGAVLDLGFVGSVLPAAGVVGGLGAADPAR